MASGWYGKALDGIKTRSLLIKVMPTPVGLSERRAVLHALQRHAQVEVFKRLTHPDTFICATTSADSAAALVKKSPLLFTFVSETLESIQAKTTPAIHDLSVAAPIETHEHSDHPLPGARPSAATARAPAQAQQPELTKTFKVHINPSNDYYEHRTTVRRNPLHGRWPRARDEDQDAVFFALRRVVPDGMARQALCDWRTGGQLSEAARIIRASTGPLAKDWHVFERQARARTSRALERAADQELVAWTSVDDSVRFGGLGKKSGGASGEPALDTSSPGGLREGTEPEQPGIASGVSNGGTSPAST